LGAIEGDGSGAVRFTGDITGDAATLEGNSASDFIQSSITDLDFDRISDNMTLDEDSVIDITNHELYIDLLNDSATFAVWLDGESADEINNNPLFSIGNQLDQGRIRFTASPKTDDRFVTFDLTEQEGTGVSFDCDGPLLETCITANQFQPDFVDGSTLDTPLFTMNRNVNDPINVTGPHYRLQYNSSGTTSDDSVLLELDHGGSSGAGISLTQSGTGRGIQLAPYSGTEEAIYVRNATGATANQPTVYIEASSENFDQDVLAVRNDGTQSGLFVTGNENASAAASLVSFDGESTTQPILSVTESGAAPFTSTIAEFIGTVDDDYVVTIQNDNNAADAHGLLVQACDSGAGSPDAACHFIQFRDASGSVVGAIEGNGSGGVTNASVGSDFAELFPGDLSSFSEGDVLALNALGRVELASEPSEMLGAYSIAPSSLGNWFNDWQIAGTHVPVGLLGQLPVNVSSESGAITAGDYLTLGNEPGKVVKATASGYVLGRALEDHAGGAGRIMAYIQPSWTAIELNDAIVYGQNQLLQASGAATASNNRASNYLSFTSSEWNGSSPTNRTLSFYTDINATQGLTLNLKNDSGSDIFRVADSGDVFISGRLYLSDQGSFQEDKYLYYDGSGGPGGDFIRTNASGFGVGSYDFAEMFPAEDDVQPGDLVVFGSKKEHVRKSGSEGFTQLAGIVSTQPGFLAGENLPGHVPIALAGRVPTRVTDDNGPIKIGDPLTLSEKPGYATKATDPGQIVGYALEDHQSGDGLISVFVRVSHWGGDASDNVVSNTPSPQTLSPNNALSVSGSSLTNIASISGIANRWQVSEDGDILTQGEITRAIEAYDGSRIDTSPAFSTQSSLILRGTTKLSQGRSSIDFQEVDPSFAKIIDSAGEYQVFLTPTSATGQLYTSRQDNSGFIIREADGSSNSSVHWMVVAFEKDKVPEPEDPVDTTDGEEDIVSDSENNQSGAEDASDTGAESGDVNGNSGEEVSTTDSTDAVEDTTSQTSENDSGQNGESDTQSSEGSDEDSPLNNDSSDSTETDADDKNQESASTEESAGSEPEDDTDSDSAEPQQDSNQEGDVTPDASSEGEEPQVEEVVDSSNSDDSSQPAELVDSVQ
jgi:hypothetical protein